MTTPPKNLPRFLPTLTEVVRPVATGTETTPSSQTAASPMPTAEALVERVMQRLTPTLETRLRAVVTALVQEQVSALEPYLWQEVDQALRQQVAEAVALELDALTRR